MSELKHHGIEGQKWGVQNGPPYPLDPEDHSAAEKKAGAGEHKKTFKEKMAERKKKQAVANRVKKMQKAKAAKKREAKKMERQAAKEAKKEAKFNKAKEKAMKEGDVIWAQDNAYKLTNEEINAIVNRQDSIRRLDSTLSPIVASGISRMNKMNEIMRTTTNTIQNINNFTRAANDFKDLTRDPSTVNKITEVKTATDKTSGKEVSTVYRIKNGIKVTETVTNNIDRSHNRTYVESKQNNSNQNDSKPTESKPNPDNGKTPGQVERERQLQEAINKTPEPPKPAPSKPAQSGSLASQLGYNADGSRKAVDGSVQAKYTEKKETTSKKKNKKLKHSAMEVGGSLQHSAKGTSWEKSNHKYIYKKVVNGKWRYYYYVDPAKQNLSELDKDEAENAGVPIIDVDKELAVKDENYRRTNTGEWWNKKSEHKKAYEEYNKARSAAADIERYEDKKKLKHGGIMEQNAMEIGAEFLAHHGIEGQKWGIQNGPPYPLDPEDHSAAEKRAAGYDTSKKLKDQTKESFKSIGRGTKETVKSTGRSIKKAGTTTGHAFRNVGVTTGHAFRDAWAQAKEVPKSKDKKGSVKETANVISRGFKSFGKSVAINTLAVGLNAGRAAKETGKVAVSSIKTTGSEFSKTAKIGASRIDEMFAEEERKNR